MRAVKDARAAAKAAESSSSSTSSTLLAPCVLLVSKLGQNRAAALAAAAMLHLDDVTASLLRSVRAVCSLRGKVLTNSAFRWQLIGYAARVGKLHPQDVDLHSLLGRLCALITHAANSKYAAAFCSCILLLSNRVLNILLSLQLRHRRSRRGHR